MLGDHALVVETEHVEPGRGVDVVRILGVPHLAHRSDRDVCPVRDDVDDMHLHARLDADGRPFLGKERHEGGNKWIGTGGTSPFGANDGQPS